MIQDGANGVVAVDLTGMTTYTLSTANGAPDQSRPLVQNYTGALTANCTVTLPNVEKVGWAANNTSGGHNVILTTGAGTTATVPPDGLWRFFYADGATNIIVVGVGFGSLSAASLTAPSVTATSTLTAPSVTYAGSGHSIALGWTGSVLTANVDGSGQPGNMVASNGGTYSLNITGSAGSVPWSGVTSKPYAFNQSTDVSSSPTFSEVFISTGPSGAAILGSGGMLTINFASGHYLQYNNGGTFNLTDPLHVAGSNSGGNPTYALFGGGLAPNWAAPVGVLVDNGVQASFFGTTSDGRAKEGVEEITPEKGIEWIMAGRPVTYTMDEVRGAGFIAQEDAQTLRALAVTGTESKDSRFAESDGIALPGIRLSRNYTTDIAFLTAALQWCIAELKRRA